MSVFDPRRILRKASTVSLRTYFTHKRIDLGIDWGALDSEHRPMLEAAWLTLSDQQRLDITADFHEISAMAKRPFGTRALFELGHLTQPPIDLAADLHEAGALLDFALHVFVAHPTLWMKAARVSLADHRASGRSWYRYEPFPAFHASGAPDICERLSRSLSALFHASEGRGHHCRVEHALRQDGQHLFVAYLSDHPVPRERFDRGGQLSRVVEQGVFDVSFACPPTGGRLDVYAEGGRPLRDDLVRLFASSVAEVEFEPDPFRPTARYHLQHLKRRRSLPFDASDIEDARISAIRFGVAGDSLRIATFGADPNRGPEDIHDMIEQWLDQEHVPTTNIDVQSVTFAIRLREPRGRSTFMSFVVTRTGSSDLRSLNERCRVIGERHLKLWGVDVGQPDLGTADARAAS